MLLGDKQSDYVEIKRAGKVAQITVQNKDPLVCDRAAYTADEDEIDEMIGKLESLKEKLEDEE